MLKCCLNSEEFIVEFDDAISRNPVVKSLQTDVIGLKDDVARLKADVIELKDDVARLKADVIELKRDVAGLKADVIELKRDVARLKTDVNALQSEVHVLGLRFEEQESKLDLVLEILVSVQEKFNQQSRIEQRLQGAESEISSIGTAFKNHIQDPKAHH